MLPNGAVPPDMAAALLRHDSAPPFGITFRAYGWPRSPLANELAKAIENINENHAIPNRSILNGLNEVASENFLHLEAVGALRDWPPEDPARCVDRTLREIGPLGA